jgi:hypothetical protein
MIDLRVGIVAVLIAGPVAASPLIGTWGGGRMTLVLTAHGGQLIEDCATAVITTPVLRDRQGHFTIVAQRQQDHPGPQHLDEMDSAPSPASESVRYSGSTIGGNLELTRHDQASIAPIRLAPGKSIKRIRCL